MTYERTITLVFLRHDGKQEKVDMNERTIADAEEMAEGVFRVAPGLYVQVDLYMHGVPVETIRNPANDLSSVGQ